MHLLISTLVTFVLTQMLFGLFHQQFRLESDTFGLFFPDRHTVALIVLSVAPWIHLTALVLCAAYMRHVPAARGAFVKFWATDFDSVFLAIFWERVSAVVILALPLAGFAYFWVQFHEWGSAWVNTEAQPRIGLWEIVPIETLLEADAHNYGNPDAEKASSFVPFWQPILLMAAPCVLCLWLTLLIMLRLPRRFVLRRDAAHA